MQPHAPNARRMKGSTIAFAALAIFALVLGFREYGKWTLARAQKQLLSELPTYQVRRGDVHASLIAGGKTDAYEKTLIECELERIAFVSEGRFLSGSGASTLLTVVPDGTWVKKGDVLATFDSSEYEEFVRLQKIRSERAAADLIQAKLNLETAQVAHTEFKNGLMKQTIEAQDGMIALAQTELVRTKDRLAWCERMLTKGYVAADQVSNARESVQRAQLALIRANWAKKLFQEFGAPQTLKVLQARIESCRFALINEERRSEMFADRLESFQRQVERCTILAPQDGMIIYAYDPAKGDPAVEAGAQIRQKQDLFYLPDMSKMQVLAHLHESVATRVQPGMRTRTKLQALDNRVIEGKVVKIAPLPFNPSFITENKFFLATIALEDVPRAIRPEMTAEVEIDLIHRDDVVTLPTESVSHEAGRAFCYVMNGDEIEKREVKLGVGDANYLEVLDGVEVGERVLAETDRTTELAGLIHDAPGVGRPKTEALAKGDETATTEAAPPIVPEAEDGAEPVAPGTAERTGL